MCEEPVPSPKISRATNAKMDCNEALPKMLSAVGFDHVEQDNLIDRDRSPS